MKFVFVASIFLCLSAALAACQPAIAVDKSEFIEKGEGIYTHTCVRCHHADGSGYLNLFPALADNPIVTLHDPVPIIRVIQNGRGSMPAYRGVLNSEEIAAVLTYIRNSWGNEASAVAPRQIR